MMKKTIELDQKLLHFVARPLGSLSKQISSRFTSILGGLTVLSDVTVLLYFVQLLIIVFVVPWKCFCDSLLVDIFHQ